MDKPALTDLNEWVHFRGPLPPEHNKPFFAFLPNPVPEIPDIEDDDYLDDDADREWYDDGIEYRLTNGFARSSYPALTLPYGETIDQTLERLRR